MSWFDPPYPPPPPLDSTSCCSLAKPDTECSHFGPDKSKFKCPEGHHPKFWTCIEAGTRKKVGCGECVPEDFDTCWTGNVACSIWWYC